MRIAGFMAALLGACVLAGCAVSTRPDLAHRAVAPHRTPVIPPVGFFYSDFKAPLTSGPTGFGSKKGVATSRQIGLPPIPVRGLFAGLDLIGWGDASDKTAAKNGGITRVEHIDYRLEVILFFYRRFTTEVYGD